DACAAKPKTGGPGIRERPAGDRSRAGRFRCSAPDWQPRSTAPSSWLANQVCAACNSRVCLRRSHLPPTSTRRTGENIRLREWLPTKERGSLTDRFELALRRQCCRSVTTPLLGPPSQEFCDCQRC